jgi:CPA1 family monovalent cation:H+ antiporter
VLAGVAGAVLVGGDVAPASILLDFLRVAGGGLLVGILVGLVASVIAHGTDEYVVEATLSVAAAYGSYLIGEQLQVSGILAVAGAGSVFGNFGRRFGISDRTEEAIDHLWGFFAFVANSLVFLLLGSAVVAVDLARLAPLVALGALATLLGRAVVAYGLGAGLAALVGAPILAWRHVLFWGGLRGALPVVVAIALAAELHLATRLADLVLGVVVVTLLVQGLTLRPVFRRIAGLAAPPSGPDSKLHRVVDHPDRGG